MSNGEKINFGSREALERSIWSSVKERERNKTNKQKKNETTVCVLCFFRVRKGLKMVTFEEMVSSLFASEVVDVEHL